MSTNDDKPAVEVPMQPFWDTGDISGIQKDVAVGEVLARQKREADRKESISQFAYVCTITLLILLTIFLGLLLLTAIVHVIWGWF